MKKLKIIIISLLVIFISACDTWVTSVDPIIDQAQDNLLNDESQMDFLSKGVQQRFSTTASQITCLMDLQSDQMVYTAQIPTASFPTFEEIEKGEILIDNATVAGIFQTANQLRLYADNLVGRVGVVNFTSETKKKSALFIGYLYGGIARFYLGIAFSVDQTTPGAVYNAGPFVPQAQMMDDAIEKLKLALTVQDDAAQKRIVNSIIAKVYLVKKDYANAATYAGQGMIKNDAQFLALYHDVNNIYYWGFAGAGRVQIGIDNRFGDYIKADPKEIADRLKIDSVKGKDGKWYYWQKKYPDKFSNMPVMTWQENNLMLAECALRGSGTGSALALVNEVRTSHKLDALQTINLDGIMVERDKEMFVQGTRLMDQHRTDKFHLAAGKWKYMPLPRNERNANPNLPPG